MKRKVKSKIEDNQLVPGTKIFAKVKGNPYWPARIELLPDEISSKTQYKVIFYGTKETALLKKDSMILYNEESKKIYGKQRKRNIFNLALREIETASDERIDYEIIETEDLDVNNNEQKLNLNEHEHEHDSAQSSHSILDLSETKTDDKSQNEVLNEETSNVVPESVEINIHKPIETTNEIEPDLSPLLNISKNKLENDENKSTNTEVLRTNENVICTDSDSYITPKKQTNSSKRSFKDLTSDINNIVSNQNTPSHESKNKRLKTIFKQTNSNFNLNLENYSPIKEVILPKDFF